MSVSAPTQNDLAIGFDIGGTNMRAGVVTSAGHIIDSVTVPSPRTSEGMTAGIVSAVETLREKHDICGVGVAIAGFLDSTCTTVRFAPHLPWRDAPVH